MALLVGSRWDRAAPYVDPVMVLITCAAFIGTPIRMVRTTVVELLEGSPAADIEQAVRRHVAEIESEFAVGDLVTRMTKVGPKLYVEIDGVVDPGTTVVEEHAVRRAMAARLETLPYEIWLNVELTPRPISASS
jgi:predicted Co/Zn/Cd cation transporter (cation efflux family)